MKPLFALVLAAACIVGSTPGFARGGVVRLCAQSHHAIGSIAAIYAGF